MPQHSSTLRSGLRKEVELTQERIGFPQIRMRKLEVNKSARTHGLRKGKRNSKTISNLEKEGRKKRAKRHTPPSLPPKKPMRVKQNIFSPLSRAVQSRRILPPSQYDGSAIFFFSNARNFSKWIDRFSPPPPSFLRFLAFCYRNAHARQKKKTHTQPGSMVASERWRRRVHELLLVRHHAGGGGRKRAKKKKICECKSCVFNCKRD